jgi:hypothetical protein
MTLSDSASATPRAADASRSPCTKVKTHHLDRKAIVYVRQSTPQQVLNNCESTQRQYALVQRAVQLGWPQAVVTVIDEDQGHSGATAQGRPGFQSLLAQVALDQVGIVLGLESSRLARSNKDWHQLLEVCVVARKLPMGGGRWAIWASGVERRRLARLRRYQQSKPNQSIPTELTTPQKSKKK